MATPLRPLSTAQQANYDLITANLQEILKPEIIHSALLASRPVRIYWGTATTGRPHAGYFVPALKLAQFLRAGCHVTVLLADLHAFLDADKAPESTLEARVGYYERVIKSLLRSVGVDLSRLAFVRGAEYQLSAAYMRDLLRLSKRVSMHDATKASSEVVKQSGEPVMADGLYPLMQALDEQYLDVDAQFGGVDQRKIFALANDHLGKLGYRTRAHLMNPMVPGLAGGKMSSSDPGSKIDLLEDEGVLRKKVARAHCAPGVVEGNGILAFIQHVLLPFSALQAADSRPSISILSKDGGSSSSSAPTVYSDFAAIASAYEKDLITPQQAKRVVEEGLVALMRPIREEYEEDAEWQEIAQRGYSDPDGLKKEEVKARKKAEQERKREAAKAYQAKQKQGQGQEETVANDGLADGVKDLTLDGGDTPTTKASS